MTKDQCFRLGKITKTHGYKGELTLWFDVEQPKDYQDIEYVLVEVGKSLIPYFIKKISDKSRGKFQVTFDGVEGEQQAKSLVNKPLFLPNDMMAEADEDNLMLQEMEGYLVVDSKHGELGKIAEIISSDINPLIAIETDGEDILIPLNENFISGIDHDNRELHVNIPEGLIDLNE